MNRSIAGGVLAMIAGAMLVGTSFHVGAPSAHAQQTGVPTQATQVTGVHTATPTVTSTAVATATSAPSTAAPNTAVPHTAVPLATSPAGGAGAAIGAPNTGTGDAAAGHTVWWEMALGLAVAAIGMGLLVSGLRGQRR